MILQKKKCKGYIKKIMGPQQESETGESDTEGGQEEIIKIFNSKIPKSFLVM